MARKQKQQTLKDRFRISIDMLPWSVPLAWLNRCRRLAKDWERLNLNALAFLRWASVRLMVRRICQTAK